MWFGSLDGQACFSLPPNFGPALPVYLPENGKKKNILVLLQAAFGVCCSLLFHISRDWVLLTSPLVSGFAFALLSLFQPSAGAKHTLAEGRRPYRFEHSTPREQSKEHSSRPPRAAPGPRQPARACPAAIPAGAGTPLHSHAPPARPWDSQCGGALVGAGPWTAVTQCPSTLRGGVEEEVAAPGRAVSCGLRSLERRPDAAAQLPLRELREPGPSLPSVRAGGRKGALDFDSSHFPSGSRSTPRLRPSSSQVQAGR